MKIKHKTTVITGGASGLGEATTRDLIKRGGKVTIIDVDDHKAYALAKDFNGDTFQYVKADVTNEEQIKNALEKTIEKFGSIHICINCAGIGPSMKTVGRKGVHSLELFKKVIEINLIGSFNVLRLAADHMQSNNPDEYGERGVIINTASIAAYDGQIGQAAYAASKGGIVGMTLPIARDLARLGIRCCTIAPGLFHTPLFDSFSEEVIESLEAQVPFPPRLGKPEEFAGLVKAIVENPMMNGETVRLDGALRMAPK